MEVTVQSSIKVVRYMRQNACIIAIVCKTVAVYAFNVYNAAEISWDVNSNSWSRSCNNVNRDVL